ncbi:MAG TPA: hypothetical protein VFV43_13330, partial [Limnobacter sp.]|nr:hypothetical protein [Limnobacter sp.]
EQQAWCEHPENLPLRAAKDRCRSTDRLPAGAEPDRAVLSGRPQVIQAQKGINRFSARNKPLLGL